VVDFVVTGVTDVWSVYFEIDYPSGFSQILPTQDLSEAVSNSFLGSDAVVVIEEEPLGHAEVAVTRLDTAHDRGATPTDTDNVLLRLGFARFATGGQGAVGFSDANLSLRPPPDPDPVPPAPADPPVPFVDGTLVIN
jgi:hypothetical protein